MRRDVILHFAGYAIGACLGIICMAIGWQLALIAHADAINGAEHRWERALERVSVEARDV